jgi:hypothetical protein
MIPAAEQAQALAKWKQQPDYQLFDKTPRSRGNIEFWGGKKEY